MINRFVLRTYKNSRLWAVLDTKSGVYLCIGKRRLYCKKRVKELNKYCKGDLEPCYI